MERPNDPLLAAPAWHICSECPPEDNEWPASAFTFAGNARKKRNLWKLICNDCWTKRYTRTSLKCAVCGVSARPWRRREALHAPFVHKKCS